MSWSVRNICGGQVSIPPAPCYSRRISSFVSKSFCATALGAQRLAEKLESLDQTPFSITCENVDNRTYHTDLHAANLSRSVPLPKPDT
jgi:hypothetical protein